MNPTTISPETAEIIAQGAAMLDDVTTVAHRFRTRPDPGTDLRVPANPMEGWLRGTRPADWKEGHR